MSYESSPEYDPRLPHGSSTGYNPGPSHESKPSQDPPPYDSKLYEHKPSQQPALYTNQPPYDHKPYQSAPQNNHGASNFPQHDQLPPPYNPGPLNGPPPSPSGFQQPPNVIQIQPFNTVPAPVVVVAPGTCPACRVGVLENTFTGCGICLAIICFPIGLVCCFLMRDRACSNCGAKFS
ncbi:hypothetical protein OTU49_004108 [Cherax quadricarinatus]|uniref:Membrane protein BRI3 n=1 Tax=Cherax quadricarinatus TaxID=27406 RepID=A0AAW0XFV5_CHEQU|nr:brain protein I3-like [Cherax quadricarinatus]